MSADRPESAAQPRPGGKARPGAARTSGHKRSDSPEAGTTKSGQGVGPPGTSTTRTIIGKGSTPKAVTAGGGPVAALPASLPRSVPIGAAGTTNPAGAVSTAGAAGSASATNAFAAAGAAIGGPPGGVLSTSTTTVSGRIQRSEEIERLERILACVSPSRGPASAELAKLLASRGLASSFIAALELAAELLSVESDAACETLTTLCRDGWNGSLGELLACARQL